MHHLDALDGQHAAADLGLMILHFSLISDCHVSGHWAPEQHYSGCLA